MSLNEGSGASDGGERFVVVSGGRADSTGRHDLITGDPDPVTQTGRFRRVVTWAASWRGVLAIGLSLLVGVFGAGAWALEGRLARHDVAAHAPILQQLDRMERRIDTIYSIVAGMRSPMQSTASAAASSPR